MKYLKTSGKVVYLALLTPNIDEVFHSGNLPYKYTLVRNFVFKSRAAKVKMPYGGNNYL